MIIVIAIDTYYYYDCDYTHMYTAESSFTFSSTLGMIIPDGLHQIRMLRDHPGLPEGGLHRQDGLGELPLATRRLFNDCCHGACRAIITQSISLLGGCQF